MISIGRHQMTMELVASVSTFRNTIFFSPLGSFLYPMFVLMLMKTKNGCLPQTFIGFEFVLRMKGFSLSAMVDFTSSPAVRSRGQSSELNKGTLTSEVTALLTTSLTIFILQEVSSSIFLHISFGTSIRKLSLTRYSLADQAIINQPRNQVCSNTSRGQHPTKIYSFLLGFKTIFKVSEHSLFPYFKRKQPFDKDFAVKVNVKKAASVEINGKTDSPQCPGKTVPRSKEEGSLRVELLFIYNISQVQIQNHYSMHRQLRIKLSVLNVLVQPLDLALLMLFYFGLIEKLFVIVGILGFLIEREYFYGEIIFENDLLLLELGPIVDK